jgi:hypothetical protein
MKRLAADCTEDAEKTASKAYFRGLVRVVRAVRG